MLFLVSAPRPYLTALSQLVPAAISKTLSQRPQSTMASATSFFDISTKDKRQQPYPLSQHKGKVVLVVNVASKCGYTPQYAELETLYKELSTSHPGQFTILGFPTNNFWQESGSNDEIQSFCQLNYGVTFPILNKIDVNGDNTDPVYKFMKAQKSAWGLTRIKWNFEKFLIGRDGTVKERWNSSTVPSSLKQRIVDEIKKGPAVASKTQAPAATKTANKV